MGPACLVPALLDGVGLVAPFLVWPFVLLMGLLLLLGTPLVMWLYRRRVLGYMRASTGAAVEPPAPRPVPAPAGGAEAAALEAAAAAGFARLRRALVGASLLYAAAAGTLLTVAPESGAMAAGGPRAAPVGAQLAGVLLADMLFVGALCLPMVLIGLMHPRFKRLYWTAFVPWVVVALALRFGLAMDDGDGLGPGMAVLAGAAAAVVLVLFYMAIARRHARQVGPLLMVLLGTLFSALAAAAVLAIVISRCGGDLALGLSVLVLLPALLASVWVAWRLVRAAADRYRRKWIGEAQVQVGCWMALINVYLVLGVVSVGDPYGGPWVLGLLAVTAASFGAYLLGLRGTRHALPPQGLLLLRVFAQDERGELLLDETAFRWRFVGPIHMIGGPDLAQQTLDPHELLLFVTGRAREQFVATPAELAQRLATLDERPDPDGRYRVNELFCFDDVWRLGVGALLARSHAVLLDLRGFTPARRGTAFEVDLLARSGALARTVCLVDAQTDLAAVRALVSPGGGLEGTTVLGADQPPAASALFGALAAAAARSRASM
jgi:hypothetical protein